MLVTGDIEKQSHDDVAVDDDDDDDDDERGLHQQHHQLGDTNQRRNQQQQRRRRRRQRLAESNSSTTISRRKSIPKEQKLSIHAGTTGVINECNDNLLAASVQMQTNGHITMERETQQAERHQTKQKKNRKHQHPQHKQLHQPQQHSYPSTHKRYGKKYQNFNTGNNHQLSKTSSSSSSFLVSNDKNMHPKQQQVVSTNPTSNQVHPIRNRHRRTKNHRNGKFDVNKNDANNNGNDVHHDDDDTDCNIINTTSTITTTADLESRKDGSLASKLKQLLEMEKQQQQLQQEQQRKEGRVHLTTLSSLSRPLPSSPPLSTKKNSGKTNVNENHETDGEFSTQCYDDIAPTPPSAVVDTTIIPNAKIKWTASELSKMRHRWWEALRVKRSMNSVQLEALSRCEGDNYYDENDSLSRSSTSLDEGSGAKDCGDLLEPPSLSAPFDESYHSGTTSPSISPTISPQVISNPIITFEQKCIESRFPLHYAIYSHALVSDSCDNNHDSLSIKCVKSDAEVVLHRLLTMQDIDEIMRWKRIRAGLSDMRGLEPNVSYSQVRANILTDLSPRLLSVDLTSLTPLQLAVYWNLPEVIHLLCATGIHPPTLKNSIEEDDKCRTPLMLACELGHVACIKSIMCASTFKKLDRREKEGGNSAFHFCCIGSSLLGCHRKLRADDDYCAGHDRRNAIDMLLQYTPIKDQKIALLSTNRNGQNLFHLACSRGDVTLLERLLDMQSLPGVNMSKALDAKDSRGHTPFLSAVAADSTDTVMHLLSTRFAASSWFGGSPLLVAVKNNSVSMVKLLLDSGYDASNPCYFRMFARDNMLNQEDVQHALFEAIEKAVVGKENGTSEVHYAIIRLLICQGHANPHQVEHIAQPVYYDQVPLLVAVRAADADCVRCMVTSYSRAQLESNKLERNDPILQKKPESYFQEREAMAAETIRVSIDAAIVTALFLLWKTECTTYGEIALFLFDRGYSNLLSSTRYLSQRAIHWLHQCMSMSRLNMKCFFMPEPAQCKKEVCYFEAKLEKYCIPNILEKQEPINIVQRDADTDCMDWSYALSDLPWFSHRFHRVNCRWMRTIVSNSSTEKKITFKRHLADDEFYLVVEGTRLLAHKSIVSARSGKLAAHIRFVESHTNQSSRYDQLSVTVDIPLLAAMMLLSHCYHGSIALGLMKSTVKQCTQLLEMALIAEEYLCPSLLLECELRLLMNKSYLEKHDYNPCICMQCLEGVISPEKSKMPMNLERINYDECQSSYCNYVGVYIYETGPCTKSSIDSAGLVTPENCLDILAIAQQQEHSSCCQKELYGLRFNYSSGMGSDCCKSTLSCGDMNIKGSQVADTDFCVLAPFAAAKVTSIWTILRNFSAVVKSKAFMHQVSCDGGNDENDLDEGDAAFTKQPSAGNDKLAIHLLQTCLEELACSPYLYKH